MDRVIRNEPIASKIVIIGCHIFLVKNFANAKQVEIQMIFR